MSAIGDTHELASCNDSQCKNPKHIESLNRLYESICGALSDASTTIRNSKSCHKNPQVPGWNDCCKESHSIARDAFLLWRANGNPKHGFFFENMRKCRAQFKYTLRQCKLEKNSKVADSLAKKFLLKSNKSFWKEINVLSNKHASINAETVEGITGREKICEMWFNHFKGLQIAAMILLRKNML